MSKKLLVFVFTLLFGGYAMAYDYFDVVCESGQTLSCSTSSCQTATVSKNHNGVPVTGNLIIPEYVTYNNKTYRVTGLDNNYAFSGCDGLTSVTIPNSVTNISADAFKDCSGLTSVTIPNSVTSIGTYAFSGCSGLTSVTIPNSVTGIGKYAFQNCNSLTSVTISNSVTAIGDGAFSNCSSLSVVNFNATNCTTMGISSSPVFNGCTSLATLNIGNNVTNIPQYAFEGTGWYNNKPDGILYLNGWCLGYKGTAPSGSLSITDGTKGIADNAFSSCFGLNSVVIPNSVAYIGNEAFYRCSHLTSVTIGNSVTRIGESAFYDCDELTSIIIPNSVTSIGEDSFMSCNSLTSITIGNSITSIGDDAFSGTGWENNQTSGILYLGGWCLGYKDNEPTGSLSIIDGTKGIADNAFGGLNCSGLTSVIIPNSVTSIGNGAFSHCSGLTSVTIGNSVTNIGNEAFGYCSGLTSVTIPSSVTSIGNSAFYNCSGLTSVTIGSGVTSIGDNAFMECESLTSVTIPNSVTRIGDKAFFMSGLTGALTIPNSVISIGKHAFNSRGEGLTSVVIGSSVTTIGDYAFSTGHLTNLTIGESVETIGQSAFCPADKIYSNALEPPAIYSCSFADEDEYLNIPVYVPCGRVSAYSNAEYWNVFTNIQQNDDCTGIEEDNELATLNMYPNPVGNTLYINAEETISNIEIVNVMGQVVKKMYVNSDNAVCDVEDLKAGVYMVRIHAAKSDTSTTLSVRRFVKE